MQAPAASAPESAMDHATVALALLLSAGAAGAGAPDGGSRPEELRVYGPGGPLTPVRGCAERFARARGVKVVVDGGPEERWWPRAETDADVVFEASEYMLTDFDRRHPGFLDRATRVSLWVRPAGILVRRGNPKGIRRLEDLARPGVKILDLNGAAQVGLWEDLAGRLGLIPALQRNVAAVVANTSEAIVAWRNQPELDAWITFLSWRDRLADEADAVELPEGQRLYRGTPVAATTRTPRRELAVAFIAFLGSEECHAVFRQAGWR